MNDTGAASPYQRAFLIVAVAGISLVFGLMVSDFLIPLLLAAIFAGMSHPVYVRLRDRIGHPALASALVVLAMLVVIVGPAAGLLGVVAAQAVQVTRAAEPWLEKLKNPAELQASLEQLPVISSLPLEAAFVDRERLTGLIGSSVSWAGSFAASNLAGLTQGTAEFLLELFVLLYAVFFFLVEGRPLLDRVLYHLPLPASDKEALVQRFLSVTRATLRGTLVIGFLQGSLAGAGLWLAGFSGAAFWGAVMMVLSVVPGVGAPLVWVPAVVWLFANGSVVSGLVLGLWCGAVVGTLDNVLRPRLVGADAEMSELLILLSTLGGISLFGFAGVLIGPIVAALFVSIWDLSGRAFHDVLVTADGSDEPPSENG